MGGLVTAVSELQDERLVMIMDVEKILADAGGFYEDLKTDDIQRLPGNHRILFTDDSAIERKQITGTLDKMGVKYLSYINGAQAWETINKLATTCEEEGRDINEEIQLVLTDFEMQEMDGYVRAQKIKPP